MAAEHFSYQIRLGGRWYAGEAEKDDPGVNLALTIDQFVEILVRGQEQGGLVIGLLEDFFIRGGGAQLRHIEDRMAFLAKSLYDRAFHSLIGEYVHADLLTIG
jgi:hypothetical protein